MKNKNAEVIEMQQTTFVQRHAKKILFATGVVVAAGAYYMLKKHDLEIKDLIRDNDILKEANETLRDDNQTLMEAASEGLFEEAIATVTRKINGRKDQLEFLDMQLKEGNNEVIQKINKITNELNILSIRRDKFIKAQTLLEIKDEM